MSFCYYSAMPHKQKTSFDVIPAYQGVGGGRAGICLVEKREHLPYHVQRDRRFLFALEADALAARNDDTSRGVRYVG